MQPKLFSSYTWISSLSVTFWRCISFVPCISTLYSDGYLHYFMFWAFMNKMILIFMYPSYLLDGRVDRIRTQCIFSIIRNCKIMFQSGCAYALCSVTQTCLILCDLMGCSHQDPTSMRFPRQEY